MATSTFVNAYVVSEADYLLGIDPAKVASGGRIKLGAPVTAELTSPDGTLDESIPDETDVFVSGFFNDSVKSFETRELIDADDPGSEPILIAALFFGSNPNVLIIRMNAAESLVDDVIPGGAAYTAVDEFTVSGPISLEPIVDPVITGGDALRETTYAEDRGYTFTGLVLDATDPQGDTPGNGLTWTISGGADANLFIVGGAAGNLIWKNLPDFETPLDANGDNVYEVTMRVTDPQGYFDEQQVEVTVTDSAPVAEPDAFTVNEDGTLKRNVLVDNANGADTDPEGEALSVNVEATGDPANGTVAMQSNGTFIYTPNLNFFGTDSFTYELVDENGTTDTGTVTIDVLPVDDAPVFDSEDLLYMTPENETAAATIAASDPDGDIPFIFLSGGADLSLFSIDSTTGALSFKTAPDYEAPADADENNLYQVQVSASDGVLITSKTVTVIVKDVIDETSGITITGTGGDDVIDAVTSPAGQPLPTELDDTISGLGGNDTLSGLGGNDTILGGAGDDILLGGDGDDTLDGGEGIDAVSYVGHSGRVVVSLNTPGVTNQGIDTFIGIENLIGTRFNDRLTGDQENNEIWGGNGNDVMIGLGGDDVLHGEDGNDTLTGSGGDDILNGGDGDDTIDGVGGRDTLNGDDGNDLLMGGVGVDTINGGSGNDDIFGAFGVDIIDGGTGDDNIRADGSGDTVDGGEGNDRIVGGNGKDILFGGAGNDTLFGGGGHGNGDGLRDVFVFKSQANGGGGFDIIRDFEDTIDKLDLTESGYSTFADVFADAAQVGANVEINFDFGGLLRINDFDIADLTAGDFLF